MSIIETIKGLFGSKATDMVSGATSVAGDMTSKVTNMVTDAASNLINFNDIDVSKFTDMINKFGLTDKLPEAIKSKLADGTLSDEDVKSFIPEIKDMIMSKMGNKDEAAHVCGEEGVVCDH